MLGWRSHSPQSKTTCQVKWSWWSGFFTSLTARDPTWNQGAQKKNLTCCNFLKKNSWTAFKEDYTGNKASRCSPLVDVEFWWIRASPKYCWSLRGVPWLKVILNQTDQRVTFIQVGFEMHSTKRIDIPHLTLVDDTTWVFVAWKHLLFFSFWFCNRQYSQFNLSFVTSKSDKQNILFIYIICSF